MSLPETEEVFTYEATLIKRYTVKILDETVKDWIAGLGDEVPDELDPNDIKEFVNEDLDDFMDHACDQGTMTDEVVVRKIGKD